MKRSVNVLEIIKPNDDETYESYIKRILETRNNIKDTEKYQEKHHIIPKCQGGSNDDDNLIWLYAQEHFYAHKLLARENRSHSGLQYAFWSMCHLQKTKRKEELKEIITAEDYEEARENYIKWASENVKGEKNPMYGKCGELNPMFNRKHKEETKRKMSEYQNNRSQHHKENLIKNHADYNGEKNPNYGKPMSDEQKKKISNARIGKYKGKDHTFAITIQCVETGEIFYSIKSAIEWCGGTPHIYECIYGNRKSAGKHPVTGERLHWIKVN